MSGRLTRRGCLHRLAVGGACATTLGRWPSWLQGATAGTASDATADVLLGEPMLDAKGQPATINPHLHGHFAEHLGHVIYDGIWVGEDSAIPHIKGFRRSLVESLRKISPPNVRWPGGCFADRYHWRDGIGPRAQRPRRFGRWREMTEPNLVGTHEFVDFCRLINAEPYFCANVGTGNAEEFQQWLEYCNAPQGALTTGDERVANGAAEPFNVKYWAIGNENWNCGGNFTPEDYCTEYRRFVTWPPSYGVQWQFIGCGPSGNDVNWTRRFFKKWRDGAATPMHGWAAHYYCGSAGTSIEFNTDQWYELLHRAADMDTLIRDQWAAMGEFDPNREVKLVVDEWGTWHPTDPRFPETMALAQVNTLRDALVAALTLDIFHHHADKLSIANIAQLVNCLQSLYMAQGDKFVETVIYHVFAMYQPHQNGLAIPLKIESPACTFRVNDQPREIPRVAGSASRRENTLTLTLTHAHVGEPIRLNLRLRGGKVRSATSLCLNYTRLNTANTFETPDVLRPRPLNVEAPRAGEPLVIELPPASVCRVQCELA